MTVTVSFMRSVNGTGIVQGAYSDGTNGFDANGNPAGKRYFELTRKPTYTADETIPELGCPRADLTAKAAWNSTTPAKRLGLTNASSADARAQALLPASVNLTGDGVDTTVADRRPSVKIEYYVPNWTATEVPAASTLETRATVVPAEALPTTSYSGAWVSYEELEARYTVNDPTAAGSGAASTPEGHTANGNVFRDVTGVRMTYYDVPAAARGGQANRAGDQPVAFPLDDVSLLGVSRYEDTRLDTTAVNHTAGEQENLWRPYAQADVSFTHTDRQVTTLDFVDMAKSSGPDPVLRDNEPVTHPVGLTKQDEGKRKITTVWRRTPVMRFQAQVFQTQAQAEATYNPEAPQKTGYVAGEQLWYKNKIGRAHV